MPALTRTLLLTIALATLPIATQAATEADTTFVVSGADRAATPMAAWERDGKLHTASGTAGAGQAPKQAVRYQAKMVHWPTATVKVLTFTAAGGGVLHPITDEKLLYVLEGSLQASVGGKDVVLNAGDVASLPAGTLRNAGAPGSARVVAWTAGSLTPGAAPAVVKAAEVETRAVGQLTIRRYEFPGNSVRVVGLGQGLKTNPASAKTDSLIYLTKGPLRFSQNGQEFSVTAGDFIREVAGAMHHWDVTEDSGFVTTSALPLGAEPIDPDKATDRPK